MILQRSNFHTTHSTIAGPLPHRGRLPQKVSMLQRENNGLAARAASLLEDLSDKTALAEALQQERSRLEGELDCVEQDRSRLEGELGRVEQGRSNLEHERKALARDTIAEGEERRDGPPCQSCCEVPVASEGVAGDGVRVNKTNKLRATAIAAATADKSPSEAVEAQEKNTTTIAGAAALVYSAKLEAAELAATEVAAAEVAAAKVAAAESRTLALSEVIDSLMSDKMEWEEERASRAVEATRLRAQARGLEEANLDQVCGVLGVEGEDGAKGASRHEMLAEGLKGLLRGRTRELEVKSVGMERLGEAWGRKAKGERGGPFLC